MFDLWIYKQPKKSSLLKELYEVERAKEGWTLSMEELSQKLELGSKLERLNLLEEINLLLEKSQALWLKEGDQNIKYFHKMSNSLRKIDII